MATVRRITKVRWYVTENGKRREVKPHTPGAAKATEESSLFYIVHKEGGKKKRIPTGMTDKRAAQAYLARWLQARERGEVGLSDPFRRHLDRPVIEHVSDYLTTLNEGWHKREVNRVINIVIEATASSTLRDLTEERVKRYLANHPGAVVTRRHHRAYLSSLCNWAVAERRMPTNPVAKIPVPERRQGERSRKRRAYDADELRRLLTAALEYPVVSRSTNTGGRPRKDGSPARPRKPAALSPAYVADLQRQGRDRQLLYRLFLATGLRRGELSRVTVGMFDGKKIVAPVSILKHKPPVDEIVFHLPKTLQADLQAHVIGKKGEDKIVNVPCASNLIREHKARMKLASVTYTTADGTADIHAFRRTCNRVLKRRGVPLHDRQRFLRHIAGDITTRLYDDDTVKVTTMTKAVYRIMSALDRYIIQPPPPPQ